MPKPSKRKGPTKSTNTSNPKPSPPTSDIPAPFAQAPETLEPFLSTLSADHFYLTSLDKHDRDFKRRLFLVPLFLNIFLTVLTCYRIYTGLPAYVGIFLSILGYESPQKIDVKSNATKTLLGIGAERALMFLGDFILLRFVSIWPLEFFLGRGGVFDPEGEASPVAWRRTVGFRDTEIVVRRSRRWDRLIFHKENMLGEGEVNGIDDFLAQASESQVFQERIVKAVDKQWVKRKTGYQMLDKSWDLYFSGMIEAHALVEKKQNGIQDFRTMVLVPTERWGWLVWEVWRDHDEGGEFEGSQKLQMIKDALTSLGKENLFFRSIEIIQSETSQADVSNTNKRRKAEQRIREEFEEQAVDFDEFWEGVGGIESMPGLEVPA